ncbi:glycoside hydrolase family 27 protein [Rhodanobacter glycinis]|uniref:Alpha-galactosidase n=2 Tax=Rhodanobacter glycinis TaxID=582702 RepID=A0A5B9E6T2_9GAMM|nr:glycoside hydrolase family 27 protein [Rhodanobacter glycinis]
MATAVATLAIWTGCATATASAPVAATPPMGWNSWNFFGPKVSEADVRAAADAMVNSGMRDAGYIYINIDDGWQGKRDSRGVIHPNARFPDMKALADYVHARGLKLGIYSSPGAHTCGGFTGSLGHEQQDANTYAAWGVDYLKYDLCSYIQDVMEAKAPNDPDAQMRLMIAAYKKMHQALANTGRPIVYSLCQYGWDAPWEWADQPSIAGNLWRTTGDITPEWDRIYSIASSQAGLAKYAGPGHWNDPDMLEVGNGKLTPAENRSHFTWWAMLAAPLLAGNDLAHMPKSVKAILTNKNVIAIDQDALGRQAKRAYVDGEVEVWTRPLNHGAMAIAIFDVGAQRYANHPFHLDLAKLGLHGPQKGMNLWSGKTIQLVQNYPVEMTWHDVLLIRLDHPK